MQPLHALSTQEAQQELYESQVHSQKIITALMHKREESFKDGISDSGVRNILFQHADSCENYFNLFDSLQQWRESPENKKPDILMYIYKTFVDANSFQHIPIEEKIIVDMRCLVMKEIDFMPELRSRELIDVLEKMVVQKLMDTETKTPPMSSPRGLGAMTRSPSTPRGLNGPTSTSSPASPRSPRSPRTGLMERITSFRKKMQQRKSEQVVEM